MVKKKKIKTNAMWFSNSTTGYIYTERTKRKDRKTPIFIKVSAVEKRKWSTVLMAADFQFAKMSKF